MKEKIYILEDDEGIRELIHYVLEQEGYEVKNFPNVHTFKEGIEQELPDLVVMDVWLPDGDGRKVCRELRRQKLTSEVRIVMMTAQYSIGNIDCADDFIPKPFDITDFLSRIEHLLLN